MLAFAPIYGEWHDYFESYTWQTLGTAANYVCHKWKGKQHSAISDCYATLAVWKYLTEDTEKKRVDAIKANVREEKEISFLR